MPEIPSIILSHLQQNPDAYATSSGLAIKQLNGSEEILVSWGNLDKEPFMATPELIEEEVEAQTPSTNKSKGRPPKAVPVQEEPSVATPVKSIVAPEVTAS